MADMRNRSLSEKKILGGQSVSGQHLRKAAMAQAQPLPLNSLLRQTGERAMTHPSAPDGLIKDIHYHTLTQCM